jgi:archaellum component FlaC
MNQDLSNFQSYLKGKVDGYAMAEHKIEKLNARVRELEKENKQLKYDFNYFGFMPQDEIRADERRKVLELGKRLYGKDFGALLEIYWSKEQEGAPDVEGN